jgi:integrase
MQDGTQIDADPKSEAAKRPISLPEGLRGDIEVHLSRYTQPGPTGRLFVGPQGGIPRRRNFNRTWHAALKVVGIPNETDLHFHDLRHTGSTWSSPERRDAQRADGPDRPFEHPGGHDLSTRKP